MTCSAGFGLVELLVAMTLMLVVLGVAFQALAVAQSAFVAEPEWSAVQQRARVSMTTLADDIRRAGAGIVAGDRAGPLLDVLPPLAPYRRGRRSADPPGTVRTDTISLIAAVERGGQTTLASALPAASAGAALSLDPGCRSGDSACGFILGHVLVFDAGRSDLYFVTGVNGSQLTLRHDMPDSPYVYPPGSHIVQVELRTYFLRPETQQLMRYDGGTGNDVPVADHVVSFDVRYLGAARAPELIKPRSELPGPWTTYGPPPPPADVQISAYPPGESCLFLLVGEVPASRLVSLGSGQVALPTAQFRDGPWCADATDPNRYDADLLRIRTVDVRLRVEAAAAGLRGMSALQFFRPGTATPARAVADLELHFSVSPVNLAGGG